MLFQRSLFAQSSGTYGLGLDHIGQSIADRICVNAPRIDLSEIIDLLDELNYALSDRAEKCRLACDKADELDDVCDAVDNNCDDLEQRAAQEQARCEVLRAQEEQCDIDFCNQCDCESGVQWPWWGTCARLMALCNDLQSKADSKCGCASFTASQAASCRGDQTTCESERDKWRARCNSTSNPDGTCDDPAPTPTPTPSGSGKITGSGSGSGNAQAIW